METTSVHAEVFKQGVQPCSTHPPKAANGKAYSVPTVFHSYLDPDGFKEYFLCALILFRHEQAVALIHERFGVVPVVSNCHICVRVSALEFACAPEIRTNREPFHALDLHPHDMIDLKDQAGEIQLLVSVLANIGRRRHQFCQDHRKLV